MEWQSVCRGLTTPKLNLSDHRLLPHQIVATTHLELRHQRVRLGTSSRLNLMPFWPGMNRGFVLRASISNSRAETNMKGSEKPACSFDRVEPFRGKSGSVSFHGLTYHSVEEAKLVSAPFYEDRGSFLWLLGPVALISSLIVPQFFLWQAIEAILKNEVLVEIVASLSFEAMFYAGLATFLFVTDRIQRPYLQFSSKRWGLITGLRGYLTSSFFSMGFKVLAPLFVAYVTWPVLGLPALVAVLPFLAGCIAQRVFETLMEKCGSSCWPLVPIIFEVYRLFQLTKATHFLEKMMFSMRELPESAQLLEKSNAALSMVVTFQVLGVVCLWSLVTFLLRLFPSRPVVENY